MILSTKEIEKRLSSTNNLSQRLKQSRPGALPQPNYPEVLPLTKPTRIDGDTSHIPGPVRDLIAITSATSNEPNTSIANNFGTSQNTVSLMKRGLVGYRRDERTEEVLDKGKQLKKEQEEARQAKRDSTHELALDNLMATLKAIKPRLEGAEPIKLEKLGTLATTMSNVVANLDKKKDEEAEEANKPKIILFAPTIKNESHYDIIEA